MGIRKLGLLMEDKPYEAALIRRLGNICDGISLTSAKIPFDNTQYDYILLEGESNIATEKDKTIILSSRPTEYDLESKTLFKYQSSKSMEKDLLFLFSQLDNSQYKLIEEETKKEIRLYSKSGGCGVTSIALTIAYLLGLEGKRAIYVNAEPINSADRYLDFSGSEDTRLLAYAMRHGIGFDISRFIKEADGFSYFDSGLVSSYSVLNLKGLENLIKQIEGFEYVIVDMGRVNFDVEGYEVIRFEDREEERQDQIVNFVPIDASYQGVHRDSEAFKNKKINHYSIFTSDIKKIFRRITDGDRIIR